MAFFAAVMFNVSNIRCGVLCLTKLGLTEALHKYHCEYLEVCHPRCVCPTIYIYIYIYIYMYIYIYTVYSRTLSSLEDNPKMASKGRNM